MSELDNFLAQELEGIRLKHRYRDPSFSLPTIPSLEPEPVSFSSNDYLGLSRHRLRSSSTSELQKSKQVGAGGSRLVTGNAEEHLALEKSVSDLVGLPSTLTFSSGYSANLGSIAALMGNEDLVIVDRQVHASILDGCRLSRAKLATFGHVNAADAARVLGRFSSFKGKKLLITESLFSMSGALAPLEALASECQKHGAFLYVDEAHAVGTIGEGGGGLCRHKRIIPDVLVGTFGKSLGTFGAFVCGSKILRDFLYNRARSFMFSTAVPPALALLAKTRVDIAKSSEGDFLRQSLFSRIELFRSLFSLPEKELHSPIIPWIIGSEEDALRASAFLYERGFFVQAIRPPTVKEGTSRLRLSFSARHSLADIEGLAEAIKSLPFSSSPEAFAE